MDRRYAPEYGHTNQHGHPDAAGTGSVADTIHDTHRLLGSYPFASATPATQVTHHLSSMTMAAAPPTYMQLPYYQTNQLYGREYPHQGGPYAQEIQHLSSQSIPSNDNGYWRDTRNEAIRLLGGQGDSAYTPYQSPTTYNRYPSVASAYQTNAFSQSMFQHTAPSTAYPTPPPPSMSFSSSSSSLALALVEPPPKPKRTVYPTNQSTQFFNSFLEQQGKSGETVNVPWNVTSAAPVTRRVAPQQSLPPYTSLNSARVQHSRPSSPQSSQTRTVLPSFQSSFASPQLNSTSPSSHHTPRFPPLQHEHPHTSSQTLLGPSAYFSSPPRAQAPTSLSGHSQAQHIPESSLSAPRDPIPRVQPNVYPTALVQNGVSVPVTTSTTQPDGVARLPSQPPLAAVPAQQKPHPIPASSFYASALISSQSQQATSQSAVLQHKTAAVVPASSFYSSAPKRAAAPKPRPSASVLVKSAPTISGTSPAASLPSLASDGPGAKTAARKSRTKVETAGRPAMATVQPLPTVFGPVSVATPRKRKLEDPLESPSKRRHQAPTSQSSVVSSGSSSSSHATIPDDSSDVSVQSSGPESAAVVKNHAELSQPSSQRKLKMYVEVPTLEQVLYTPQERKKNRFSQYMSKIQDADMTGPGDFDEFNSDGDDDGKFYDEVTTEWSARKTGDRDARGPFQKLIAIFDNIFEAEDSLPPDPSLDDLSSEYFSPLTSDPTQPCLHPTLVRKITKYISLVTRASKRGGRAKPRDPIATTPRAVGRLSDVEPTILTRILKLLERSVRAGEELDPFKLDEIHTVTISMAEENMSPTKGGKKGKAKASAEAPRSTPLDDDIKEPSEEELSSLTHSLAIACDSILAAEACLALLCGDRLAKHLYSEDLISACLSTIKNQLTRVLYPFIEAAPGIPMSAILYHLVQSGAGTAMKAHRQQISNIFQALSAALPRIDAMVYADSVAMSDSLVIQAVYIAIGPFFVVEGQPDIAGKGKKENVVVGTLGSSAMRGLRLGALSLIRSIFANHDGQRSWIIEEILSSLTRLSDSKQKAGQFRLRDGRSIRTVSALLLQLVQNSAHDVRLQAQHFSNLKQQQLALRRQESSISANNSASDSLLDEQDYEELGLYSDGLRSANTAAKVIVSFLTQRSGKTKATKNANESEYRTIFENLISDVMTVLFWPEWPAASILLEVIYRYMVASLEDIKINPATTDNNAAKSVALDHLGLIAARIRTASLKSRPIDTEKGATILAPLSEIIGRGDSVKLAQFLAAQRNLIGYLSKRSLEDHAYDSARELSAAIWGQELAQGLRRLNNHLRSSDSDDKISAERSDLIALAAQMKCALSEVWKDYQADIFDAGSQEEETRMDTLAEELGTVQNFQQIVPRVLKVVISALDAPPVFMRTKALRALGQIVTSDPTVLSLPNVRAAIEAHLLDSSAAVRDAAVELIGKYMLESSAVATDYYRKISDRIADTGLGVRKRVIKLLRSIYETTKDIDRQIDICNKIVMRMFDEDETVKDLAVKSIEEMWFSSPSSSQKPRSHPSETLGEDKEKMMDIVAVIMGVCTFFKDRQSPLEDMLHSIMNDKIGADVTELLKHYTDICETLIDGLVDASEIHGFTIVNCIRTIHLFAVAYPAVLSTSRATTLLPYVKHINGADEQLTSEYLLKIFKATIPHMPKTAAKFGQDLQQALQPLILKPAGGLSGLQESVACMCAVVKYLTHDYNRLVALLKSCDARLQQYIKSPGKNLPTTDLRAQSMLIFIVSLLGEHCDFDNLRATQSALAADLNVMSPHMPIIDHLYNTLLNLYEKYTDSTFKGRVMHCLGFLFRAKPTLMLADSSTMLMDAIMSSKDEDMRGRLLKLIQEFLLSQLTQHAEKQRNEKDISRGKPKVLKMDELIGNADDFADSAVSLSIVQRYLEQVFSAALSPVPHIQSSAVDILSFTVRQGMTNPMQCLPTIVALETCSIQQVSLRASALHSFAHSKYGDQMTAWTLPALKGSFEYQKTVGADQVKGLRMAPGPTALLHRWYLLVREKRSSRQDFLFHVSKVFDFKPNLKSSQDEIDFVLYVAENLSSFEYKTQEEVLTVIYHITKKLSTTGTQIVETVLPSNLLAQLHGDANSMQMDHDAELSLDERLSSTRASVIVGMLAMLRVYLQVLYGIGEDKCNKWVFGKKSALGDKAASRKHEEAISWDRLTFATTPMLTSEHINAHRTQLFDVWNDHRIIPSTEDDDT